MMLDISHVQAFLGSATPQEWIKTALQQEAVLLVDHANCEKKAAATAMNLMYRYVDKTALLQKMSQLAREELLHFEQVVGLMQKRGIIYEHIGPARYASGLREHMRSHEPAKLVDTLIIGAFVEARSCERFAAIAPYMDEEIRKFYLSLLKSESRHFEDYLALAQLYSEEDITERIDFFRQFECSLILEPDEQFRFHSGMPYLQERL